ncbi:hypothetical protein GGI17_005205 [Coemansia sp. S146]|nr:hypothetical protein GGI17_005205 [Coemansia sp. S146]
MRKLFVGFLASSLVGIAFCQDSSAVNAQLSVSKSMSGVLLLDGGETMCGVAMLNEAYGLVAANCIPFVSTREPDMSKGYQVAVSQDGNKLYGTRGINRITVHPAYNANTDNLVNNHVNDNVDNSMGTGSDEMSRVRRWWLFGGGANEDLYNPSEYARSYNQQSQPMSKPLAY